MWRIVCCTFSTVIRGWWWWGGAWVNYGKLAAKLGRFSNQSPPLVPAKGSTPHFKSLPEIIPSTFFLWIFHPNSSKWKGKIKWRKGNSMDPSWSCEPVDAVDLSLLKLIRRSPSREMGARVLFLYAWLVAPDYRIYYSIEQATMQSYKVLDSASHIYFHMQK